MSVGFGCIHSQIRILQQLVRVCAVVWRQGDADAGLSDKLWPPASARLAEGLVYTSREIDHVARRRYCGLNNRKPFSPLSRATKSVSLTQARGRVATTFNSSSPTDA